MRQSDCQSISGSLGFSLIFQLNANLQFFKNTLQIELCAPRRPTAVEVGIPPSTPVSGSTRSWPRLPLAIHCWLVLNFQLIKILRTVCENCRPDKQTDRWTDTRTDGQADTRSWA